METLKFKDLSMEQHGLILLYLMKICIVGGILRSLIIAANQASTSTGGREKCKTLAELVKFASLASSW